MICSGLIPEEALALPVAAAGAGTSGLHAIATRFLKGDPAHPGLYTSPPTPLPRSGFVLRDALSKPSVVFRVGIFVGYAIHDCADGSFPKRFGVD